ncbi:MAG: hypothetical protein WCP19_08025 [Chloroflexota bacterium]
MIIPTLPSLKALPPRSSRPSRPAGSHTTTSGTASGLAIRKAGSWKPITAASLSGWIPLA